MKELTPIKREFYNRDTIKVAKDILGKVIVRKTKQGNMAGRIVEVEAYKFGEHDKASHASKGCTLSNQVMFGENGFAYVYFTYGMYFMLNVVAKKKTDHAGAVLIRGVEPIDGIKHMIKNRKGKDDINLTNGPGKLSQALQINKKLNNYDLTKKGKLFIVDSEKRTEKVLSSGRIGISMDVEKEWRFYLDGNTYVSKYKFNKK
ncbi:MAG TPA: DNA-3-methyladenine glycosylase [Nitrososphaerales archaeon]|nr:DNA-3-methyladenine glycosylase [Nitrososphaerales archaeon]NSL73705.1 DNA-3-methyladenine glycosylase [Nitrososphaerota archaeon]NSL74720.1 DNA-3-methyladenine glycosylase [Nitrososphaerota archaeon]PXF23318.1 MAG: DNA-3-methyladenine glycosylase [Nitrososphaerota archaeon]HIC84461.1 DNA-3-methyladenine glycosylase [Nitrososphaerales archaeon]